MKLIAIQPKEKEDNLKIIYQIVEQASDELSIKIEEYVKIKIRPAPRFFSKKLWLRLAVFFIYMELLDR